MPRLEPDWSKFVLLGTGEFSFADGVETLAAALAVGFRSVGNVKVFEKRNEVERRQRYVTDRGKLVKDKTFVPRVDQSYVLTADELTHENLLIVFSGTEGTPFTQSSQSSQLADAWDFSGGNDSDPTRWYDVRISAARIRELSALTITGLTETTDFIVDYKGGRIRFVTLQQVSRQATISAAAVTSSDKAYMKAINVGEDLQRRGMGRLTTWDQDDDNNLFTEHDGMLCEISVENNVTIDPENPSEFGIMVDVIKGGTLYTPVRT